MLVEDKHLTSRQSNKRDNVWEDSCFHNKSDILLQYIHEQNKLVLGFSKLLTNKVKKTKFFSKSKNQIIFFQKIVHKYK